MVLTEDQKTDIKVYLVYKAELRGSGINSDDPLIDEIISRLSDDFNSSALEVQLIEESIIYKQSIG